MTDRELLVAAALIAVAAGTAIAVAWWMVVLVAVAALIVRHRFVVCLLGIALASMLGARAERGIADGPTGAVHEWVTLVTDPELTSYSTSAIGRLDEHLVLIEVASPEAAAAFRPLLAGQNVLVTGRAAPIEHPTDWHRSRHLAARLDVRTVSDISPADAVWASANRVRSWMAEGSASLDADQRALFAGLVIGDDRDQSPLQQHAFRASGLAHLLAVSGQNVAFVLLVVSPLTGRLLLRSRFAAIVVVLVWFVVLTRFEPSVLRSVAMASVAAASALIGRRSSGLRVLSIAVAAVVLADPLIVWSFGFRLSVGASLGLVLVARPLGAALPVPSVLAVPLGVTLAATAGTAPLLVSAFGVIPAVSPLANLLAVPVAGAVMVWGMTAGVLAGLVPPIAPALHLPTRAMLWWLDGVARLGADPRWPRLGALGLAVVVGTFGLHLVLRRGRPRLANVVGLAVAVLIFLPISPTVARPAAGISNVGAGAQLVAGSGATVLVVRPGTDGGDVLDALDAEGVSHLDALVVTRQRSSSARAVAMIRRVYGDVPVVAPDGELVPDALVLTGSATVGGVGLRRCGDQLTVGPEPGPRPLTCPP